jgi:hypothetical protein
MNHLVQQGVLDLGPRMAGDVPPADRDLQRASRPDVHAQLPQPRPHASREPDREAAEHAAEMLQVESLPRQLETVQQHQVAGPGAFAPELRRRCGRMPLGGKGEQLALRQTAHGAWQPWIEKTDDRLQDGIGGVGVAAVQTQHPARPQAHHDGSIGMGDDPCDTVKAQPTQAAVQPIRRAVGERVRHSP